MRGGGRRPVGRPRKDMMQDMSKLATHSSQAVPGISSLQGGVITFKQEPAALQGSGVGVLQQQQQTMPITSYVNSQGVAYQSIGGGEKNVLGVPASAMQTVGVLTPVGGGVGGLSLTTTTSSSAAVARNASSTTIPSLLGGGDKSSIDVSPGSKIVGVVGSEATPSSSSSGVATGTFIPPYPPPPLKSIDSVAGSSSSIVIQNQVLPAVGVAGSGELPPTRVYKKRGPKKKNPVPDGSNAATASSSSFQLPNLSSNPPAPPTGKRRRGRPKGSGTRSEVLGYGYGRGRGRRGGRLPSHPRLPSILPRPLVMQPPDPPVLTRDDGVTPAGGVGVADRASSWEDPESEGVVAGASVGGGTSIAGLAAMYNLGNKKVRMCVHVHVPFCIYKS